MKNSSHLSVCVMLCNGYSLRCFKPRLEALTNLRQHSPEIRHRRPQLNSPPPPPMITHCCENNQFKGDIGSITQPNLHDKL